MEIGDEVVAGLTCGIKGKLGNDMAATGGGGREVVSEAIVVAVVEAIGGLYLDSERGVRSRAPCDISEGAGDDWGCVLGLFELLSLST